ncbi:hypothetical protein BV22DRAFT_1040583 [Leucogyrophana mollusca]|uniref:Uncharacterized protein n=1 Tax=Leucogyrophana mollusca TaxID=85980 RepID=A0ACB8B3F3_9AGAM|nr:hypothetical protein BV22DRAFT_1040583 [Leucogyrophana mollusca]
MSIGLPTGSSAPISSASAPPSSSSSAPLSSTSTAPSTSSAPSSATSANTSSTTPASSSAVSSTSTAPSSTAASTSSVVVGSTTDSAGSVAPYTSVVYASPSPSVQPNNDTKSSSFFSNTGAVAGVFTVVGLVVVAIFIALVTNAVRRRRAKRFDRDVAEAAAEAAASARSPFDDYAYSGSGSGAGGGGTYAGYSDNSHGTFAQAPMSLAHPNESYGMSEMSRFDPYSAGAASLAAAGMDRSRGRTESETGAPGIAGVGAGNLAREPSRRSPYHAFAGPGQPQPQMQMQDNNSGSLRYRRGPGGTNQDILEAAGLASTGAAAMAANGAYVNRRPSEHTQPSYQSSGRRTSQGYGDAYPAQLQPGYKPDSFRGHAQPSVDPYGGYAPYPQRGSPSPGPGLPNPHEVPSPSHSPPAHEYIPTSHESIPHSPAAHESEEEFHEAPPGVIGRDNERLSYQDDDDYGQTSRVLRVANE